MGFTDRYARFPATMISPLEFASPDHKPIMIHPSGVSERLRKPWRFDQVWLENEGCHETVASAWGVCVEGSSMKQVMKKLSVY